MFAIFLIWHYGSVPPNPLVNGASKFYFRGETVVRKLILDTTLLWNPSFIPSLCYGSYRVNGFPPIHVGSG